MSPVVSSEPQAAGAVLMVRPASFASNPQTAASNAFQAASSASLRGMGDCEAQTLAAREFDALAGELQRLGLEVIVAADSPMPEKPDAIFPNNWVSFHRDGTVVLYPMLAPNRRLERRMELLAPVMGRYLTGRVVDLSQHEIDAKYLEGTGSLVLDRIHRVAYAGRSPRTHADVLEEFCRQLCYEALAFDAADAEGRAIYHTNVFLAVGTGFAVLCGEVIADPRQRHAVLDRLHATGREIVEITAAQMYRFAANMLELRAPGGAVVALSLGAWSSLDALQRRRLERYADPLIADIPIIEHLGGGGVRCMLAEIHLQTRAALQPMPMS